ncbi:hypothetical protein SteCoe_15042 [Stentor coeruleus]|uniref:RING-type domain-containing protein n=1 Tax=Stentor coeruleus TaxID=5963 RepID=A0A1R2C4T7_9CILI|nr:hypothetical protein SteCoe_15042 [Stentor coeruleus]
MENDFLSNLKCPICQNIFINPFIAGCCSNTFCVSCIGNSSKCPLCKKTSGFTPNRIVNNMIDTLPYACACGRNILRKDRASHEAECEKLMKSCTKCNFVGNLNDRIEHMLTNHSEVLISYYSEVV